MTNSTTRATQRHATAPNYYVLEEQAAVKYRTPDNVVSRFKLALVSFLRPFIISLTALGEARKRFGAIRC